MDSSTENKIAQLQEELEQIKTTRKSRTMMSWTSFEEAQAFSRPLTQRAIEINKEIHRLRQEAKATRHQEAA